jgi:hypothetical protein
VKAIVSTTIFNGRAGATIENDHLRVTVLQQGGHIAEIFDKQAQVSPLWIPPWHSIEPSTYDPALHSEFGTGSDAKLLAGIMGHNLCLDIFGGPSPQEAEAGVTAHGEASVDLYRITEIDDELVLQLQLPLAQLHFERRIQLSDRSVRIREAVENLASFDRPIAWTQHVTLGPPFLNPMTTQFQASVTRSMVSESDPGSDAYLKKGDVFEWPEAPRADGRTADLRQMNGTPPSSGFTTHLTDSQQEHAFFVAYTQKFHLAFGYVWKSKDFPWLGIWEENCSRQHSPWNGHTITRGMEFGVSPIPESRREMVERGVLFGTPTYRWLPAKARLETEYWSLTQNTDCIPERLIWPTIA